MTAITTTPVESTACTTEIGARAIAATCSSQAPSATAMPIANQRERNSPRTVLMGRRMSTVGAAQAPRCL